MNRKIRTVICIGFVVMSGSVLGTSSNVEAGHLVIESGTIYLEAPLGQEQWVGTVSKQILGEEFEREGTVVAEIISQRQVGDVFLQTVYLTETYEQGTLSHISQARVTPTLEPLVYYVQALTTVTEGTGEFEGAEGRWSVRGVLDLRCLRGLPGDPENRSIYLEINGGYIHGPQIP